ncbi:MAG: glycosyltransferase family 2 protein [Pseudomonadota bacterium]
MQSFFGQRERSAGATVGKPLAGGLTVHYALAEFSGDAKALSRPEPHLLKDRNVLVATRNGESEASVLAWITYHRSQFNVTGVVVIDRQESHETEAFWSEVAAELTKTRTDARVIALHSPAPLGMAGLPPEPNRYCVPEAPGRDRMVRPPADPRVSPLGEIIIYEIIRARFLKEARAVANIDVHDLMRFQPGIASPFDLAVQARTGVVSLEGRHCHPWQVRRGDAPTFSDHVCVQFDSPGIRRRWCVAPPRLAATSTLKLTRVSKVDPAPGGKFDRFMAVRHSNVDGGPIVPKSSLIEDPRLVELSGTHFGSRPRRPPDVANVYKETTGNRITVVTCMKNEGPFLLEWIAYHRAIGVDRFLVYTNDCTDGTDTFLELLQRKGLLEHRDNPFKGSGMKPQHAALLAASDEPVVQLADWLISMDVDEYINVKVGQGTLNDLFEAVGDANMISLTWRLFGNSHIHEFHDAFTLGQFDRCAAEFSPKPHQAWGFKTLFRNNGIFKKLGVHRPKGLHPQLFEKIRWVNGSGGPMPVSDYRNAWRSTSKTYGYDLVSLNHYAVRNVESFLVKRDRGRVNHADRDQGLAYWFRMNVNSERDTSINARIPMMAQEYERLMSDPQIAKQQRACVLAHQNKISVLRQDPAQEEFYAALSGPRMERLSTMHKYFGSNVFFLGPQTVPDKVVWAQHEDDFFFTVPVQGASRSD